MTALPLTIQRIKLLRPIQIEIKTNFIMSYIIELIAERLEKPGQKKNVGYMHLLLHQLFYCLFPLGSYPIPTQ